MAAKWLRRSTVKILRRKPKMERLDIWSLDIA